MSYSITQSVNCEEVYNMNDYTDKNHNPIFINIAQYLSTHKFVPHTNGNIMNYGLNSFGCNSIIEYNNDIWKFVYFNKNNAVYVNKDKNEIHFNTFNMSNMKITRMMEV